MNVLNDLLNNSVLLVGFAAWFAAQALKVVFTLIIDKRLVWGRMFGLGGMPSSHSSVVSGMAAAVGIARGFYSVEFAICCLFAMVVMTDAAGVRRAAGKQAVAINKIIQEMIASGRGLTNETLKEMLGHTPFEVIVGALLGVLIAIIIM